MLFLVSFAGMTLNKCAVLCIGTLTGGPVQGESPPVLVKESHIQNYSRTSVCGRIYLGVVYRKDRIYQKKKKKKKIPTYPTLLFWSGKHTYFFYLALLNMQSTLTKSEQRYSRFKKSHILLQYK